MKLCSPTAVLFSLLIKFKTTSPSHSLSLSHLLYCLTKETQADLIKPATRTTSILSPLTPESRGKGEERKKETVSTTVLPEGKREIGTTFHHSF